ncbi:hypothetical protein D9615_008478 [Tricholomella constricta]|uniref:Uncharacterized protein n=1 Tax=Tricholomella constricta TaxID=117010 RepID=A0A8H5M0E1_9AGAR|nr:hypothetical protein D9615_008478 [Tricholomella constricta]
MEELGSSKRNGIEGLGNELKDAFFADLASTETAASEKPRSAAKVDVSLAATKGKPKLKKKATDDPFASDDDEVQAKTAKGKPQLKRKVADKPFVSDDDDAEEEAKRKAELRTRKAKATSSSKKRQIIDSDDENEVMPKKRRSVK